MSDNTEPTPVFLPKISDYALVYNRDPVKLADDVREMLADNWQPLGGVSANHFGEVHFKEPQGRFYQAMVKYQFYGRG